MKAVLKTTPLLQDQALLTLGFQTGFRISELLSLTVGGITESYGQVKSVIMVARVGWVEEQNPAFYNLVKHSDVNPVRDWKYSSVHR